jgi:hypothetical protein
MCSPWIRFYSQLPELAEGSLKLWVRDELETDLLEGAGKSETATTRALTTYFLRRATTIETAPIANNANASGSGT